MVKLGGRKLLMKTRNVKNACCGWNILINRERAGLPITGIKKMLPLLRIHYSYHLTSKQIILLPRLHGYKVCMFTKHLVVINKSSAPINKEDVNKNKALGVIWHEGICGRKDDCIY